MDFGKLSLSVKKFGKPQLKCKKNWTFTLNNYTEQNILDLNICYELNKQDIKCICWEKEMGAEKGTPHLQGFMIFNSERSLKWIKTICCDKYKMFMHLENMICKIENNSVYCDKEKNNTRVVLGVLPLSKEQKGKLGLSTVDIWKQLDDDIKSGMGFKNLVTKYPSLYGKCKNGFDAHYSLFKPLDKFDIVTKFKSLYEWQKDILEIVKKEPSERQIIWIYDEIGNSGKTDMASHLCLNNNFKVFENGKTADIAYAWNGENVIFDLPRSQEDHINYGVLESIKNGKIFSSKYESQSKYFSKKPYVIVFANFKPKIKTMSLDRWDIRNIGKKKDMTSLNVTSLLYENNICIEDDELEKGIITYDHIGNKIIKKRLRI